MSELFPKLTKKGNLANEIVNDKHQLEDEITKLLTEFRHKYQYIDIEEIKVINADMMSKRGDSTMISVVKVKLVI